MQEVESKYRPPSLCGTTVVAPFLAPLARTLDKRARTHTLIHTVDARRWPRKRLATWSVGPELPAGNVVRVCVRVRESGEGERER